MSKKKPLDPERYRGWLFEATDKDKKMLCPNFTGWEASGYHLVIRYNVPIWIPKEDSLKGRIPKSGINSFNRMRTATEEEKQLLFTEEDIREHVSFDHQLVIVEKLACWFLVISINDFIKYKFVGKRGNKPK